MFLYGKDRKKEEHTVKILFYDTKSYDKESFEAKAKDYPDIQIEYLKSELVPSTAKLAKGYDAICAFVSSDVGTETIDVLSACGVKLILMRCAGFNNVDVEKATACGIKVMRVPGYSPEAVAEHAMALALAANRRIHKAITISGFPSSLLAKSHIPKPLAQCFFACILFNHCGLSCFDATMTLI